MKRTFLSFVTTTLVLCLTACNNSDDFSSKFHEHTFSSAWAYDETNHWHSATCGHDVVSGKAIHSFTDKITEPTFETTGYTTHTCTICGFSYTDNQTSKLTHNYSNIWSHDETSHWHACTDSGYENLSSDLDNHVFGQWIVDKEPTCSLDGLEYALCNVCNYRKERTIPGKHTFENHVCTVCGQDQEFIAKLDVSSNGDKTLFAYIYDDVACEGGHELYFEGNGYISGKFNLLQIDNYNITSIIYGEGVANAYFYSNKSVYLKRFLLSDSIVELQSSSLVLECDLIFPANLKTIKSLSGFVDELILPSTIERIEDGALSGLRFNKITINCVNAHFGKRVFGQVYTTDYVSSHFSGETVTIGDFVYVIINEGEDYVLTHVNKNRKDTSFTTITIEEKTMFWEAYSTYGCWYVTDVFIPSTLKYIGMMVFFEMYSLETIHYNGTIDEFSKIIKEDYSQYYNTHSNNGYSGDKIVDVICNNGSTTLRLWDGYFS